MAVEVTPPHATAINRSGTITAGNTAQDLMPANPNRKGWALQNQSSGNLYVRSKGSDGATVATLDQNCVLIQPGAYYTPEHTSDDAHSIIGATTGQAFYAREW